MYGKMSLSWMGLVATIISRGSMQKESKGILDGGIIVVLDDSRVNGRIT